MPWLKRIKRMAPSRPLSEIVPPKSSQRPSNFVVPIQRPPAYKINAVANFKRQKLASGLSSDPGNNIVEQTVSSGSSTGSSSATASPAVNVNNKAQPHADGGVGINNLKDVYLGLQREQENLRRSSRLIKDEIASLNDIERSLKWLLKKARQYETQRNHLPYSTSG
jgi:hypothetical protein